MRGLERCVVKFDDKTVDGLRKKEDSFIDPASLFFRGLYDSKCFVYFIYAPQSAM